MAQEALISLLQEQMALQREQLEQQREETQQQRQEAQQQLEQQRQEAQQQRQDAQQQLAAQEDKYRTELQLMQDHNDKVLQTLQDTIKVRETETAVLVSKSNPSYPSFHPFDATSELWSDYWARFTTFLEANSIPLGKRHSVFLTNQSPVTYKLLSNLAAQQTPPVPVNALTLDDVEVFMKDQFDPKRFVVRERYNFWSSMRRKPGENIQELAARIRHDAVTCDFSSIKDPLDEAMRTRFTCSVNNEAVLKALFKRKDDDLTFANAIQIAMETEDAAKVAKETIYGPKSEAVNKVSVPYQRTKQTTPKMCMRCGKTNHKSENCFQKSAICNFCKKTGHLEIVCLKKKSSKKDAKTQDVKAHQIKLKKVNTIDQVPEPRQAIQLKGETISFEVDSGAADNFVSQSVWRQLGSPSLKRSGVSYVSASKHSLPIVGTFASPVTVPDSTNHAAPSLTGIDIDFVVTTVPDLNILGRSAIRKLGLSVDALLCNITGATVGKIHAVDDDLHADHSLQQSCEQVCQEFPNLFKAELGCIKGVELEIKFKPDAQPKFCKPRPVPFAIQDDLALAYDTGIARGVWEPIQFNDYGTPVVPVRKHALPGQKKASIRVCGDYSATINSQLETHRQPIPSPDELMHKLGGNYYFTKVDLADAYNQIPLGPESQKRLALSTHRGVLLQRRLPFGISSATGYFQEIMGQLTSDLPGVSTYLDDLLVTGRTAGEHVNNLRRLLARLDEKGLRVRQEKCQFAQPSVEYLGHTLSRKGISKGGKVNDVLMMPEPANVSQLRAFLGSVQFYAAYLPPDVATITEPLHRLTRKNIKWEWRDRQSAAFQKLKQLLSEEKVLAHFDPSLEIGISCDASEVGLGVVLFHRWSDGSERPIANASKTLTETQRRYGQVQKEALAVIYGLKKYHQYLYGRKFILITDHKPLMALFGPDKATPALAANRLARWALMLAQYDYTIEYRPTNRHGNADALSRLPASPDRVFDKEEDEEDIDTVCTIHSIGRQLSPTDPGVLVKESSKDPMVSAVMRYVREGWPVEKSSDGDETADPRHGPSLKAFKKLEESLSITNGCLLYGSRVVIPTSLQPQVLQILHLGHFGIQRMKQLARTAVYWPLIDSDVSDTCRSCTSCAEYQNLPAKAPNHPWMVPEKPWSRLHLDHAINFMGSNWLVLVDAYSRYPCIQPTSSTSTRATTDLLEETFGHFGYPHTIVTDNATTFKSAEFQEWCRERGIVNLSGAPYHPQTNGTAERLVQTFKQALRKSSKPPKRALHEFLMQYRRTPVSDSCYSPSELLNGRQIRTAIDVLLPSPTQLAQQSQSKVTQRQQREEPLQSVHHHVKAHAYKVGDPCYALYCGPNRKQQPRWVSATICKVFGSRSVNVKVYPRGPTWRRHIDQLRPRYGADEDADPGDETPADTGPTSITDQKSKQSTADPVRRSVPNQESHTPKYGPSNPRRSRRTRRPVIRFDPCVN